jgi:hypothetical protein
MHIRAKTTVSQRLAEEAADRDKKLHSLPTYLADYSDVFEPGSFDELPPHRDYDHAIKLVPNALHRLDCKIYPLNAEEQKQLDKFLTEQLHTGRIQPSKSPMASPFFFVKKKDGKLRPVQDYRWLDSITIPN